MRRYIIPIFIPHYGCQHACVFCNQHTITGVGEIITAKKIRDIIETHLCNINQACYIEVAFYGGSFTAIAKEKQIEFLAVVAPYIEQQTIDSIRISTRPDCIDEEILDILERFGVTTIEIGVQSFDDSVLRTAQRGHTEADVVAAVTMIRRRNIKLGLQLMPGLPGETWQSLMRSTLKTIKQAPDFVRIYPTVILQKTALATMYNEGEYQPLSLDKAIAYSAWMKQWFEAHGIAVIRTGLQSTEALDDGRTILAGPYHPAFGEMVDARIFYSKVIRLLEELQPSGHDICLYHYPADASKIRGNKNENTRRFIDNYQLNQVQFKQDPTLRQGQIRVIYGGQVFFIN